MHPANMGLSLLRPTSLGMELCSRTGPLLAMVWNTSTGGRVLRPPTQPSSSMYMPPASITFSGVVVWSS